MIAAIPDHPTGQWALERYEQVRARLPSAHFPATPVHMDGLAEIADHFDAFIFDSFGVLNVGETPIAGAAECVDMLRQRGKSVAILTNAATVPLHRLEAKYHSLGLDFSRHEIISSRELLSDALSKFDPRMLWGIAAPPEAEIDEMPIRGRLLDDRSSSYAECDGYILLSAQQWTTECQQLLHLTLQHSPKPLLVGNPDIVAPREGQITLEPGAYAHAIADDLQFAPRFFGKPFDNAFSKITGRFSNLSVPRRIAMVGDSLHTDILGGAAAGWCTVLVTDHGLLKDADVDHAIASSGIMPDFIVPGI